MIDVRFRLEIEGDLYLTNPRWGDDLAISLERENESGYLKESLEGALIFQRDDYELILSQPLGQKIFLLVEILGEDDMWAERLRLEFYRIDCKFDPDSESVTLGETEIISRHSVLENGLSQEHDVFLLGVPEVLVNYKRQPVIQVYRPGSLTITNIVGGNYWEEEVTNVVFDINDLLGTYFFARAKPIYYVAGAGQLAPDVSGEYVFNGTSGWYERGSFSIRPTGSAWNIHENTGGGIVFNGTAGETDEFATVFTNAASSCMLSGWENFIRILSNQDTIDGNPTDDIPANDIVPPNRNYTKVYGISYQGVFGSDDNTVLPTQYGQFPDDVIHFAGNYYEFPFNDDVSDRYYPILRSNWTTFSAWIYFDDTLRDYQIELADDLTAHGFLWGDILDKLANKIDPRIGHDKVLANSDFLYAGTNVIRGKQAWPILVPKSNILVGDYDQPDSKEVITLSDLLSLATGFWNCRWVVRENFQIQVEHELFWENGGSYIEEVIGADADVLEEPKHALPWSFGDSGYSYDVERLVERIEIEWDDDTSPSFNGYPIEVTTNYVKRGGVKKYPIGRISSDIDFGMANPDQINKEGFFLIEANLVNGEYISQFTTLDVEGLKRVVLQNGLASMVYGQEQYWDHGLPAREINRNLRGVTASSAIRAKMREDIFAGDSEFDYYQLVKYLNERLEITGVRVSLSNGVITIKGLSSTE